MNKKIKLMMIIILGIGILSTVGMATAKELKGIVECRDYQYAGKELFKPAHQANITKYYYLSNHYRSYEGVQKINGKYYKKYYERYWGEIECGHSSHGEYGYTHVGTFSGTDYQLCKKGDVIKTNTKVTKTKETKGKVYKWYKTTKTYLISETKTKTKTINTKKLYGYYKKFTMPSTSRGKLKTKIFKGVVLDYGCIGPSFSDYAVYAYDGSKYKAYKITTSPKVRTNYNDGNYGYFFWKKPRTFTIYVKKY